MSPTVFLMTLAATLALGLSGGLLLSAYQSVGLVSSLLMATTASLSGLGVAIYRTRSRMAEMNKRVEFFHRGPPARHGP